MIYSSRSELDPPTTLEMFFSINRSMQFFRLQVRPLLNVILASERGLTEAEVSAILSTCDSGLSKEDLKRRCQVARRVLSTAPDLTLRPFHNSFAEWLLDVKHCTQRYLCSAPSGHAMIIMHLTAR